MRGVYTASYLISGLSAAKTLMYITTTSSIMAEILSASVTDATNVTNQQLEITLQRVATLGTPTATSITPAQHENSDQAAVSTVKANVTASEPTYTANTQIGHEGCSSLGGWFFDPMPEERPLIPPSATMGLRLLTSSPTAQDTVVRITFRELG